MLKEENLLRLETLWGIGLGRKSRQGMAQGLWKAADAAAATGAALRGTEDWTASGLSIDTRNLQPGDLFLALPGEKMDGHAFLRAAQKAGAAAAMVTQAGLAAHPAPDGLPLLVVPPDITPESLPAFPDSATNPDDAAFQALLVSPVFIALWKLADAARRGAVATKIVAVTGSVGKTSAKEAIALALSAHTDHGMQEIHATQGNLNNHLGLPITLATLPTHARYAVLEMGMNHAGEIAPLTRLARPDVALVTTVDAVHAEFFDSVESIAHAKAEIFQGVDARFGRYVIPRDNEYYPALEADALDALRTQMLLKGKGAERILTFGLHSESDVQALDVGMTAAGTEFILHQADSAVEKVALRAVGAHWVHVALAALAVVAALGLSPKPSIRALKSFQEPTGRGRLTPIRMAGKAVTLIDDSYNASPISMTGAIRKLGMLARGEKRRAVAVLGQMLELGQGGPEAHRALAEVLKAEGIDLVFLCGGLMKHLAEAMPQLVWAETAEALRPSVEAALQEGDLLLVKGSHGSKVYQLAEAWGATQ